MRMHNPPHPGDVLRELCVRPLGLTVTQTAAAIGVSRKTLSAILNGRAGISPEMAIRLSLAFTTTAESWLNQQVQDDLATLHRREKVLSHDAHLASSESMAPVTAAVCPTLPLQPRRLIIASAAVGCKRW